MTLITSIRKQSTIISNCELSSSCSSVACTTPLRQHSFLTVPVFRLLFYVARNLIQRLGMKIGTKADELRTTFYNGIKWNGGRGARNEKSGDSRKGGGEG